MKNLLFLVCLGAALTSCKKDYDCTCISNSIATSIDSEGFFSSQTEFTLEFTETFEKEKEEDAKEMCDSYIGTEETVETEGTITTTEVTSTSCDLEEK